jgi:hypothetical protein
VDLTTFVLTLDERRVWHRIERHRDAIMVVPGEYWGVEFMDDGGIEVERFRGTGHIEDETVLEDLWRQTDDTAEG